MNRTKNTKPSLGPILALDLGKKRVGAAFCDSMNISITKLAPIARTNWKQLLSDVRELIRRLDATSLVIGLPLSLDGGRGSAAEDAEYTARKFAKSLKLPVYLQDERLTSVEAEEQLRAGGKSSFELRNLIDSQAAAIILKEFIAGEAPRTPVSID